MVRKTFKNICKECRKEFESFIKPKVYCSNECRRKPHNHPLWKGGLQKVNCDYCGKEIEREPSIVKTRIYNFCNRTCKGLYWKENMVGENSYNWRGGSYKRTCVVCGKEFYAKRYLVEKRKYGICCSNECRYKWKRLTMSGAGNPMYEDGRSKFPYCEKFNAEFKRRVRAFFDNKCVLCGKTKEENNSSELAVHHVYSNKQACCDKSERRFVSLCMSCHTKVTNSGKIKGEKNKEYYVKFFNDIIDNQYNGKCYYTKEEYYKGDY